MKQQTSYGSNQTRNDKVSLLRLVVVVLLAMTFSGCSFLTHGEQQDLRVEMNEVKLQMGRLQQTQVESFRKITFSLEQLERKLDALDKSNSDLGERLSGEMTALKAGMTKGGTGKAGTAANEGSVGTPFVVPATTSNLTPAQNRLLQSAGEKFAIGEYDAAIDFYSQFLIEYPDSSMSPDATYDLARCYYAKQEYARAELGFERLLEKFPTCDIIPQTLASCALCEISQSKFDEARATIEKIEVSYPEYDPGLVQSIRAKLPE